MDKISISDEPKIAVLREAEVLYTSDTSSSDLFDSTSSKSPDDSEIQWIEATEPYEDPEGLKLPIQDHEDGELNGCFIAKEQLKTPLTKDEDKK